MRYVKRPVVVEAIKWTGSNYKELEEFLSGSDKIPAYYEDQSLRLMTMNGFMSAQPGDYVIKGFRNEVYPCKESSFKKIYEPYNG